MFLLLQSDKYELHLTQYYFSPLIINYIQNIARNINELLNHKITLL